MQIVEREVGDMARLIGLIDRERDADRRDRLRIVLLALRGREKLEIAELLGVARSTVERWAYACRDRGIDALAGKPRRGGVPKIRGEHAQRLKRRLDEGPTSRDGVCTLRGRDIQRIAREEFGVDVGLSSVYRTLERLGYSCLTPRPRHEKQDPAAQKKFKEESAPLFVRTLSDLAASNGMRPRVFFMDEARFGQQGTTTRVWAPRGSRPTAVKQTRYEWVYLYAAVEPVSGVSVALQAPHVNTGTMNVFLKMLSDELGPSDHAVLIMDQAGWHKSKALKTPANITALYLPPYSPELNPVERLWAYLRSHYLSNRVFEDYDHLLAAGAEAWQKLTTERLRSVCACPYLSPELTR